MAVVVKNIIVGAGNLWTSKLDSVTPEPIITTPAAGDTWASKVLDASGSAWRNVGATMGGLEVAYTPDTADVEVDQLKDAALVFNTGQTMTISTTLAEATLANLVIAWGYRSTDLIDTGDTLNLAAAPDALVERSVAMVGNAPTPSAVRRERLYYGRRVISVEGSTHTLNRTEATGFPVTFRLLPDPTAVGSEYGKVKDRTIT